MIVLKGTSVLVVGLQSRGRAACEFLHRSGSSVVGIDSEDTEELREATQRLVADGVSIELGVSALPQKKFHFAVLGPEVSTRSPLVIAMGKRSLTAISELELGFHYLNCLSITVGGTNGKSTTAELIERALVNNHRKTLLAGHEERPICSVAGRNLSLDMIVLMANAFQLEIIQSFRPTIAVLMNLAPDHLDRFTDRADYVRANARLFRSQQTFDWAVIQSEAHTLLKQLDLLPPSKIITFSASDSRADLYLERGVIVSRLEKSPGPLLDMSQCRLQGPHNAENFMAALAVGQALLLHPGTVAETLRTQPPAPHRFELIAEIGGVQFINDSKAENVQALRSALLATRPGSNGGANVWLLAGGRDKGLDFRSLGPLLSQRVKGAFLFGEAREKILSRWNTFTPCTLVSSLLEAIAEAAKKAAAGDVILLSPACSSFDQFRNYQQRGECFYEAVKSIYGVDLAANPNINGR